MFFELSKKVCIAGNADNANLLKMRDKTNAMSVILNDWRENRQDTR